MEFDHFRRDLNDNVEHFDGIGPIHCARAPGRLDVMGGIADYSGSIVLEKTLEESTWVGAQLSRSPTMRNRNRQHARPEGDLQAEIELDRLFTRGGPRPVSEVREALADCSWARYIVGCVCLMVEEGLVESTPGLNILSASTVP